MTESCLAWIDRTPLSSTLCECSPICTRILEIVNLSKGNPLEIERKNSLKREKRGKRVSESRGRAKETGKICGVSKRQVLQFKSKHDSDHVGETGIEREISEVSKHMGRSQIEPNDFDETALSQLIFGYYLSETTARNPHFGKGSH